MACFISLLLALCVWKVFIDVATNVSLAAQVFEQFDAWQYNVKCSQHNKFFYGLLA